MSDQQALAVFQNETPMAVLQDTTKYDAFYARIKREMESFVPDVTTDKGRKEIASQAFKVTKTKTAIDDARKLLTEDARKLVEKANAAGKVIRDQLDELAKEVRKPLTDWEEAEDARKARVDAILARIAQAPLVSLGTPSGYIADRLTSLSEIVIGADEFQERAPFAQMQLDAAKETLSTILATAQQAERDAAELEKLREAERVRLAEAEAKAEEECKAEEAKRAEQDRLDREKAELEHRETKAREAKEREEKRVSEAAEQARKAEIDKAAAEQAEKDRKHAEEIAARDAEIERQNLQRQAEEKAKADEQAAADLRAKNRAHKGKLMGESKVALMTCGIDEEKAKAIVTAIVAGMIPHVTMTF